MTSKAHNDGCASNWNGARGRVLDLPCARWQICAISRLLSSPPSVVDPTGRLQATGQCYELDSATKASTCSFGPTPRCAEQPPHRSPAGHSQILQLRLAVEPLEEMNLFSVGLGFALHAGTAGVHTQGTAVTTDHSGNTYVTGTFSGTVNFNPGPSPTLLTSLGAESSFVAKYSPAGTLVWVRTVGTGQTADVQASSISVDSAGNLYIAGTFQGGTANFAAGGSVYSLTPHNASSSNADAFVVKLDTSGNLVWATDLGGTGTASANGLAVDSAGNVDVVGSFSGTMNLATGNSTTNLTSTGGTDI